MVGQTDKLWQRLYFTIYLFNVSITLKLFPRQFREMNNMERHKESRLGELENFVSELAYELNHTDKALPQILQTCRMMRMNLQNKSKQCDEYYQEILYLRHQLGARQPVKEKAGKQESKRPKSTAQKYSQKTLEKLVADQTTMVRTLSNEI